MENIIVISSGAIDQTLQNVLDASENYKFRVLTPDTFENTEDYNYSLVIFDANIDILPSITDTLPKELPVLICTDSEKTEYDLLNREYDIIFKPMKEQELVLRISNLIKIKLLKDELGKITVTDELTGLYNRKFLIDRLTEEMSRSKRYETPITCMLMDIDYFKVINDMYGYTTGDQVLRKLSGILKDHVRKEDILTRYGDEEFIIALPNTTDRNAYVLAERIRKAIKSFKFFDEEVEEEPMHVTISIGISTYPYPHMEADVNTLIRYAEHALYNAKKQGKNKVVLFSQINFDF